MEGISVSKANVLTFFFFAAVPRAALTVTGRLEAAGRAEASITAIGTTDINLGVRFVRDTNR